MFMCRPRAVVVHARLELVRRQRSLAELVEPALGHDDEGAQHVAEPVAGDVVGAVHLVDPADRGGPRGRRAEAVGRLEEGGGRHRFWVRSVNSPVRRAGGRSSARRRSGRARTRAPGSCPRGTRAPRPWRRSRRSRSPGRGSRCAPPVVTPHAGDTRTGSGVTAGLSFVGRPTKPDAGRRSFVVPHGFCRPGPPRPSCSRPSRRRAASGCRPR